MKADSFKELRWLAKWLNQLEDSHHIEQATNHVNGKELEVVHVKVGKLTKTVEEMTIQMKEMVNEIQKMKGTMGEMQDEIQKTKHMMGGIGKYLVECSK